MCEIKTIIVRHFIKCLTLFIYQKLVCIYIYIHFLNRDGIFYMIFFLIFFSYTIYLGQSVQFSCSVMSDSLRPHGLQHTRLPCPPLSPEACSNSCPSSHLVLCHPLLLLTSVFPSIRVFSNSLLFIRLTYWNFS